MEFLSKPALWVRKFDHSRSPWGYAVLKCAGMQPEVWSEYRYQSDLAISGGLEFVNGGGAILDLKVLQVVEMDAGSENNPVSIRA